MKPNRIICFVFVLFFLTAHTFATNSINQESVEYNRKGETKYKLKKYNEAILFFEKAIEIDIENFHAFSNLGIAYQKVGRLNDAINANKKALDKTNDNSVKAASYYNNARIYEKLKKWNMALDNYKKALKYKMHPAYEKGINRVRARISQNKKKNNIDPKSYVDLIIKKIQYPEALWLVRQSYEFSNNGCIFNKYWMTPTSGEENKEVIPIAEISFVENKDGILMKCVNENQCIKVTTDHGYKGKEKKSFILPNTKDLEVVIDYFKRLNRYCNQ